MFSVAKKEGAVVFMKKWFGFLFVLALILGCVFLLTPEANALTEGGYTYTVSGGNATITKCSNASGEVTVPTTLGGYPVTAIYSAAFQNCTGLTSIIIPDGIISLGGRTFIGCSSLTNVTIGNTVTEIGSYAFQNCSALTTVTIGSSVKTIGAYAFQGCSSLSGIVIPDSVTKIGSYAFNECSGLASLVISSQVTSIEKYTFCGCSKLTSVVIPEGVTFIGPNAFKNCSSLQQITLPASVTDIGTSAFSYCSLTDVTYIGTQEQWDALVYELTYGEATGNDRLLRANVTIVSQNTDPNLSYYTYFVANDQVTITDCSEAISGEIMIPAEIDGYPVTRIGKSAFDSCTGLTGVIIPESVTSIGSWAFYGCSNLQSVYIPSDVTTIDINAFKNCSSLQSVTIPSGVTKIADYAFMNCTALTSVTIMPGVTEIGEHAFSGCSGLTKITLPSSVTTIGKYAFYLCSGLQTITITSGVTELGSYAFDYCTALTNVTYRGTAEQWDQLKQTASGGNEKLLNATVIFENPNMEYLTYSIADGEVTITGCNPAISGKLEIPATIEGYPVTAIAGSAFASCYQLTGVTIPDSVHKIGNRAFMCCTSLYSASLGSGITTIDEYAFSGCTYLRSITIPNSVTTLGNHAFDGCSRLYSVTLSENLTEIADYTFQNCEKMDDIVIPSGVNEIGAYAFYGCICLTNVTYMGTEAQWDAVTIAEENDPLQSANITFAKEKITGISIQSAPTKQEYWIGEELDLSGLVVNALRADGTSEAITQGYTVSGYDATTPGKQTITVTYESFKATFTVTVKTRSVASVTISQLPANLDCWKGKDPDLTGLVLSVNWNDGTKELVIEGYTFRFDSGVIGDQTLLVTYEGKTVAFTMRVKNGDRCGDNLSWVLDDTGTLTITGTGAMTDFANSEAVSWYPLREDVKKVVIGEGVTSIGKYAFSYCSNLTEISIPSGVLEIGGYAFERTHSLQQVKLPSGLETMGSYLFYRSEGLRSIVIPDSVTSLGASAFSRCVNLKQVTIGAGITKLERYTFYTCTSLTEITVPNNVTVLGEQVFENCSALTTVTFGRQLTEIGKKSFSGCTALKDVYYGGTDTNWEAITIGESNELLLAANLHAKREITLVVTEQPQNVVAQAGDTVFFTVQAESSGATYKWQYSNDGEKWNNTSLPGYNTNTLTVANVGTGHHGRQYRVIITDANGNKIESETATLQIPYLKKDSATAFSVPVNTDHVFSVEFSITEGVTYQWQYKGNTSSSNWANTGLTGNKTPNLTVKALSTRNGYQYRCIIKYNGQEIITKAAILYVAAENAIVVKNPEPATAVCGDYATFAIEAQGEGALYHWQWYHAETDTWVSTYIAGYHTPELKVKTNNYNGGRLYRCRIKTVNGSGWNEVYTEPAMLTVLPAAEVTQQPQNVTVKAGETAEFSVAATGEGLTYQWQWAKFVGTWRNTTAEGATTETLTIANVTKEMNGRYYRVIITNKYDGTITTEYVQLTVQ